MTETDRLFAILRASPKVMAVLQGLAVLAPPQWRLMSGAVFQTVWNALSGRDPDHGLKDYDIGYFDPDLSWDAEDRVIRAVGAHFPPPLRGQVEIRNQARVHLWFETRFGQPYGPALGSTDEALTRFVAPAFAVGVRLEPDGSLSLAAPFGLDDVFAMIVRPNPRRGRAADWDRIVAGLVRRWPEITVREGV